MHVDFDDKSMEGTWVAHTQWSFWRTIPKDIPEVGGALIVVTIVGDGPYTAAMMVTFSDSVDIPEITKTQNFTDLETAQETTRQWADNKAVELRNGVYTAPAEA